MFSSKFRTPALLMAIILARNAVATETPASCPLRNPQYASLRAAVVALASSVNLPADCSDVQQDFQAATDTLSKSADTLITLTGSEESEEVVAGQAAAAQALTSLDTINKLVNSRCGKNFVSSADYVSAFVDTLTYLTPYLLLFGGPTAAPYVLGTAVAGTSIKAFVEYLARTSAKMDTEDKRRVFIENSCVFYNVSQNVDALRKAQNWESTELEQKKRETEAELERLNANPVLKPQSEWVDVSDGLNGAKDEIALIRRYIEGRPEVFACREATRRVAENFAGAPVVWALSMLGDDLESRMLRRHAEFFRDSVDQASFFDMTDMKKCHESAKQWVATLEEIVDAGIRLLEPRLKEIAGLKEFREWRDKVSIAKKSLEDFEARKKYIQSLLESGAEIEMSEIVFTLSEIEKKLFGKRSWWRKGPAEWWLTHKLRQSRESSKKFHKKYRSLVEYYWEHRDQVDAGTLTIPEKAELCSISRHTWDQWDNSRLHAHAGRTYCETFDHLINKADYRDIWKICFKADEVREKERELHDCGGTSCRESVRFGVPKTLPEQLWNVGRDRSLADWILEFRQHLKCEQPAAVPLPAPAS